MSDQYRRMHWFCFHNSWLNSPGMALIAKRSNQPRHVVISAWVAINNYASNAKPRGSLNGMCIEDLAYTLELDDSIVEIIIKELTKKGYISKNCIADWEDLQVRREDLHANDRKKAYRARQKPKGEPTDSNEENEHGTPSPANVPLTVHNITEHNNTGENITTNSKKSSDNTNNLNSAAHTNMRARKRGAVCIPHNFSISEEVRIWAAEKGYGNLEEHLEAFRLTAQAKGYEYNDWNAAFKKAVASNWANISGNKNGKYYDKFGKFDSTSYLLDGLAAALDEEKLGQSAIHAIKNDICEPVGKSIPDRKDH